MFFLTRREQLVLLALLGAFIVGLGVKHYRALHAQSSLFTDSLSFGA